MKKVLYEGIEHMRYVAVVDDAEVFYRWCVKWQIAPEDIFLITFSKENNDKILPAIKALDSRWSLILFDSSYRLYEVDNDLLHYLFHTAMYYHWTNSVRPKTVAGRIINWLPDDTDKLDGEFWTPAKERYLRYLYPDYSLPQMVVLLRCTLPGLKRAIARLQLNKVATR